MTDERPDSLAAQAASWVPPWERAARTPDRGYQAAAAEPDISDDIDGPRSDADDFDEDAEGPHPPEYDEEVPPELAPLPGEAQSAVTVDAPRELPDEDAVEPTDVGNGPELPLPDAIEEAAEEPDESGAPVDAPLPPDGDDAEATPDDDEPAGPVVDEPTDAAGRAPRGSGIPGQARAGAAPAPAVGDAGARTGEMDLAESDLPPMDDRELRAALEAVLLVVDEPVAEMQLAQVMEQPTERVAAMLEDISARYTATGNGFDLRRAAGGWRLYTRPEYAPYVERFVLDGQSVRLTQAALETLAVVAYKQPVTRSRISAIRGVNCDGVMRTLVTRGLIEECGTESETGAFLYRTTPLFLEKLGLNSVDQLPPLAPFLPDDVEEVLDASG